MIEHLLGASEIGKNMGTKSIRAVERAIDVLQVIRARDGSAGVSEISQELGLAKSTVHRILVALLNKGMVRKDVDTNLYSFGYTILEFALTGFQKKDIISVAMPYLEELRDKSGETAALALKVGIKFTYVVQVVSPIEHRVTIALGRQYPLHWTGTGKAILAFLNEDELAECLEIAPTLRATPYTITDREILLDQIKEIRNCGYAVSFSERQIGSTAIASPILNRNSLAVGALAVIGPESRLREIDWHRLGEQVAEVSRKVDMIFQASGLDEEILPTML